MLDRFFHRAADDAAMVAEGEPKGGTEALAKSLEVLASAARLDLLRVLRTPHALHEIRVTADRSREGERPDRPLTRQAVARHLDMLLDANLVRRIPGEGGREGDRFALNHERVFAVVDGMRGLAKLRPLFHDGDLGGATLEGQDGPEPALALGPRLLLAYGRDDGVSFSLAGAVGTRWRVGRAPGCEVRLDYDPFLSGHHATIDREAAGFVLRDEASRNGTWVNWARLPSGGAMALAPGDLLTVGRSNLVFQP